MRESARPEPVKDRNRKAGWIQMRYDYPRMEGKHEAWREDARVGHLEGGGIGFRAWKGCYVDFMKKQPPVLRS
jgi:hypothetical protein